MVPESWFFRDERPFQLAGGLRPRALDRGDPRRPPLAGPEPALRRGRGAVLDRHHAAGRSAFRPAGSGSTRLTSAPGCSTSPAAGFTRPMPSAGSDLELPVRGTSASMPEGYELDPAIRSTVRFLQANVLDPQLLEGSPPYDVVFCRNLLIYLDAPARARVLATLDRLLAADGVLFIGHADRLDVRRRGVAVRGGRRAGMLRLSQGARRRGRSRRPRARVASSPTLDARCRRSRRRCASCRSLRPGAGSDPHAMPVAGQRPRSRPSGSNLRCWIRPPSWPTGAGTPRRSPPASSTFGSRAPAPRRII